MIKKNDINSTSGCSWYIISGHVRWYVMCEMICRLGTWKSAGFESFACETSSLLCHIVSTSHDIHGTSSQIMWKCDTILVCGLGASNLLDSIISHDIREIKYRIAWYVIWYSIPWYTSIITPFVAVLDNVYYTSWKILRSSKSYIYIQIHDTDTHLIREVQQFNK